MLLSRTRVRISFIPSGILCCILRLSWQFIRKAWLKLSQSSTISCCWTAVGWEVSLIIVHHVSISEGKRHKRNSSQDNTTRFNSSSSRRKSTPLWNCWWRAPLYTSEFKECEANSQQMLKQAQRKQNSMWTNRRKAAMFGSILKEYGAADGWDVFTDTFRVNVSTLC